MVYEVGTRVMVDRDTHKHIKAKSITTIRTICETYNSFWKQAVYLLDGDNDYYYLHSNLIPVTNNKYKKYK